MMRRRDMLGGITAAPALKRTRASAMPGAEILAHCRDVAVRASMYMDAGETAAMLALFTPDLAFVRPSTWPEVSIRGRADFAAVIARRPATFVSRHLFTNVIADPISATQVRVCSYFTHYSGTHDAGASGPLPIADALRSVGEYDDRFERRGDRWLIARREGRFVFGGR